MSNTDNREIVRFPLKLDIELNSLINEAVLNENKGKSKDERITKQRYIIEAVLERIKKEGE